MQKQLDGIGKTRDLNQHSGIGSLMSDFPAPLPRRLLAEGLGTAILVATVVGSGIMAERLAGGNQAIALLGNMIPTGAILIVIITILGPISGAHFNPVVTLVFATARSHALERGHSIHCSSNASVASPAPQSLT